MSGDTWVTTRTDMESLPTHESVKRAFDALASSADNPSPSVMEWLQSTLRRHYPHKSGVWSTEYGWSKSGVHGKTHYVDYACNQCHQEWGCDAFRGAVVVLQDHGYLPEMAAAS